MQLGNGSICVIYLSELEIEYPRYICLQPVSTASVLDKFKHYSELKYQCYGSFTLHATGLGPGYYAFNCTHYTDREWNRGPIGCIPISPFPILVLVPFPVACFVYEPLFHSEWWEFGILSVCKSAVFLTVKKTQPRNSMFS